MATATSTSLDGRDDRSDRIVARHEILARMSPGPSAVRSSLRVFLLRPSRSFASRYSPELVGMERAGHEE
jgi:hypothetical protein